MTDLDTESILLQCVDAVTGVKIAKLSQIVQPEHFSKFISKLEHIQSPTNFKDATPSIQSSLKEYFLDDNLVDFKKAEDGDNKELKKLVLLLLYTAFIADKDIRTLLSGTLDHQLQLKLKYLFECIQKRASSMSEKYLDVLISENLEQHSVSSQGGNSSSSSSAPRPWMAASPVVYTSSPKAAPHQSPLKELVQSPTFRIQRKLDSRVQDVKRLNKELSEMENEKAEWLAEKEVHLKKCAKLEQELQVIREQQMALRKDRDNLESRVLVGEDQIGAQAQKLGRELSLTRSENSTLQQTLKEVMDKNEELSSKDDAVRSRLTTALKEREQFEMQLIEVREEYHVTTGQLDEREQMLKQHVERIQDLEQQLQESRQRNKPHNFTIESLDVSQASPFFAGGDTTPQVPSPSSQGGCENMGTAVVDLVLQETQQQLQALQEQHSILQQQLQEVQQHNELTNTKLAASEEQCSSLHSQLALVQAAKEQMNLQLQSASTTCEEQNLKLTELQEQGQLMMSSLQAEQEKVGQLQQQMLVGSEQLQHLRQQLEEKNTQLVESSHHAQGLSSQLEEVVKQKAGVERDYAETVATLKAENNSSLEQLKQTAQLKVSQLENELLNSKNETSRLTELNASSTAALEEQKQRVSDTVQQLQSSQSKVSELDERCARLVRDNQQQQQVLQDKLEGVTKEMEQKITNKDKFMSDVKAELCGKIDELKHLLTQKETDNQCLSEKFNKLKSESAQHVSNAQDKVEELTRENDTLNNKLKDAETKMTSEICKVQAELLEVKTSLDKKCCEIESLASNNETNVQNLKTELTAKDAIVQALNKSVSDLQKAVKAKESALEKTKEEFLIQTETILKEKQDLTNRIEEDSSASKEKEKQFHEKVQQLESSQSSYEAKLAAEQSRIESLTLNNEGKEAKLLEYESSMQQLKDQVASLSKQIDEEQKISNKAKVDQEHKHQEELSVLKTQQSENISKLAAEMEQVKVNAKEEINCLNQRIQNKTEELNEKSQQWTSDVQNFKNKTSEFEQLQTKLSEQVKRCNEIKHGNEQKISVLENENKILKTDRNAREVEKRDLVSQCECLENEQEIRLKEINKNNTDLTALREKLQEKEESIKDLLKNLDDLRREHTDTLAQKMAEFSQKENTTEKELKQQLHNKINELDTVNKTLLCKEETLKESYQKETESSKLVAQLQSELASTLEEKTSLQSEISAMKQNTLVLEQEIGCVKEKLELKQKEIECNAENEKCHKNMINKLELELEQTQQQQHTLKEEHEAQSSELENNYKIMLEKQQKEKDDLFVAEKTELTKQISSLTEAVKLKEGVIISLMESVHDKDEEAINNNTLFEEKIKVVEDASQRSIQDLKAQFEEEKNELAMKVKEATNRVAVVESTLTKKEDTLVQRMNAEKVNEEKCIELQKYIDQLKAKQVTIVSDYTKQGQELELVQKDLTDFKHGCTILKTSIEKDKEEHKQALLTCENKYSNLLKQEKDNNLTQQQEMEAKHAKQLTEKDRNLNVLQRQYEQLFQQNQTMDEEHSVKLSQLQSDLDTIKQESSQMIKRHKEECTKYETDMKARQSEVELLQNRIQEITMAQEMMKIDISRSNKEYEIKIKDMRKGLEEVQVEKQALQKNVDDITVERDDVLRQIKEFNEIIAKKESEISDVLAKHALEIQHLKDKHNEHACFLEDKVSNMEQLVDQLKKGGDFTLQKCTETYEERIENLISQNNAEVQKMKQIISEKETSSMLVLEKNKDEYEDKIKNISLQHNKVCEQLQKVITDMENELKVVSSSKTELESKVSLAQNDAATEVEKNKLIMSAKEAELVKCKNQIEGLQREKTARIAELEGAVSEATKQVTALMEDKSKLEQAISERSSDKIKWSIKLLDAEAQVKVLSEEVQNQKRHAIAQKTEIEEQKKRLHEVQEMATSAQQLADKTTSEADGVCLENKTLRTQLKDLQDKVKASTAETEQLKGKVLQAEASLIDKEKECTAAKEDVMRVERMRENDVHSLKEEMVGLKKKYKDDKQAYADKMKIVFKDQIAKLMAEVEKYKTISDDCKLLEQKYEAAKHKLAQAYADLSDATTAKEDYYQQMNKYKEHVSRLRESVQKEQELRLSSEGSCNSLRAQMAEATAAVKKLQTDKQSLKAVLATADSKIRELDRNWSRESLGGAGNGSTMRTCMSDSTLTSDRAAGVPADHNSAVTRPVPGTRQGGTAAAAAAARRQQNRNQTSAVEVDPRTSETVFRGSYRKAVGRASTVRGSSSSTEDNLLDGSDVPLLTRKTRSATNVFPATSKGPNKAKSSDGLFRKPSIRITASDDRTRGKTPVELRALTSHVDVVEGEEEGDEELWEEGEKKFLEEKEKRALEGERKKRLAVLRDQQTRRMTVDGRSIKDEIVGHSSATPSTSSKRRSMTRSVPRGLGTFFSCEDEDQEFFSNKYLQDMKVGRCVVDHKDMRMSELQRRNSLYPPHMRSSYAAEMQFNPLQDKLDPVTNMLLKEDDVKELASATERLVIESPAFNLRKRKSLSDSQVSNDSLDNSMGKKVRRLSTSYSRPGPPTPGRKSLGRTDKENKRMSLRSHGSPSVRSLASSISSSSLGSSRRVSRSPTLSAVGSTPATKSIGGSSSGSGGSPSTSSGASAVRTRGAPATPGNMSVSTSRRHHHTPASIKRLIKGKSPWKKLTDGAETPKANKLKIFRRPFGSKNYNVLSASQRVQDPADPSDSLNASTAPSSRAQGSRRLQQNRSCQ